MGFLRMLRQAAIAAVIITILLIIVGAIYLLFFSPRYTGTDAAAHTVTSEQAPFAPTPPAADAKEGVAIEALAPTVQPGSEMSVVAATNATSHCTIKVDASVATVNSPDLAPQSADDYGTVTWNWRVSRSAHLGAASLTITCVYHGRTGIVVGNFQVTND